MERAGTTDNRQVILQIRARDVESYATLFEMLCVTDYTMHYLTLYQYGLSIHKLLIINESQALASLAFVQDRHQNSLVVMYIVSNRFPQREATQ